MKVEVKHLHDQKKNEQAPGIHGKKISPKWKLLSFQLPFWVQLGQMKTFPSLYSETKRKQTRNYEERGEKRRKEEKKR